MPTAPKLTPWGRRARAALVLRGVGLEDVVEELNISRKTLERTMRGERQPRDWETRRLAELLEVPEWFLREGLEGFPAESDESLAVRMERIEGLLTGIAADLGDLKRAQAGGV